MPVTRGEAAPHLSDRQVADVLAGVSVETLSDLMREVFRGLADGTAASTDRVRAQASGHMASAMAAAVPSRGVTGGKLYSTVAGRFTFLIALFDLDGTLMCTMDGSSITEARTPALSALAIDLLAAEDAHGAAVIGTGRECLPHLRMLSKVIDGPLRLWGRNPEIAQSRCREASAEGIVVDVAPTVAEATSGCGVIVTVTSADDPVLLSEHVDDRTLVCAVGATKPQRCEIDPLVVARAPAVVTDSVSGSRVECGDLIRAADAGLFDWERLVGLDSLVTDPGRVPRAGKAGPALFETQGVAAQDVATASLVWELARAL